MSWNGKTKLQIKECIELFYPKLFAFNVGYMQMGKNIHKYWFIILWVRKIIYKEWWIN